MLVGIYLGQYCITTLTWFFLTWFPIYLVKERGMSILQVGFVAALPALCGFGGRYFRRVVFRLAGAARKVAHGRTQDADRRGHAALGEHGGLQLRGCAVGGDHADEPGVFGKGVGALGWAVISDTSPKSVTGLCGGLFNTFGNTAGIVTPIAIGYISKATGSIQLGARLCERARSAGDRESSDRRRRDQAGGTQDALIARGAFR